MADRADQDVAELRVTRSDAAILAAALRQYEPYWRPDDPDHTAELSALVADVSRLLAELRPREVTPPPGLLGALHRGS